MNEVVKSNECADCKHHEFNHTFGGACNIFGCNCMELAKISQKSIEDNEAFLNFMFGKK